VDLGPADALPAWAGAAPGWSPLPTPSEPALPSPLAPSRPEQAALGKVPAAASPLAERDATGQRFRRGQLAHTLLQHLPALPPGERAAAARRFLRRPGLGIAPGEAGSLADEVLAVLDHPDLAPLFGPAGRAEVPLAGVVAGTVIGGLVDRLVVLPDRVLIADYKTNRAPPAHADAAPVLYLRQMAAYRAVLRAVYSDRAVTCALVWTVGAVVMPLPDPLLDRHAPGAGVAG
jgi:ATP-dependent helicase/nuclease subunit A